eukprot:scaffold17834_cov80-Phaeocystis_antarctica.AAC.1
MAASSCADNGGSAVRSAAVAESMPTSVWNLDAMIGSTLRLLALAGGWPQRSDLAGTSVPLATHKRR